MEVFWQGHCLDSIWLDITRLGESGFLMPIGVALPLWFLITKNFRLAFLWILTFGLGVSLVVFSKLAFLGWGIGIRAINFTGFSGHTMLAASVFPTLAWLVLGHAKSVVRDVLVALAVALSAAIALSRVELGAHSISEVITGFMLGAAVSITFVALAKRQPNARVPAALVLLAMAASALLGMGRVTPSSHRVIASMALWASGHQHTYHRDQWLAHEDYQET
jgi:membrane-associated phospholipid phosphatase